MMEHSSSGAPLFPRLPPSFVDQVVEAARDDPILGDMLRTDPHGEPTLRRFQSDLLDDPRLERDSERLIKLHHLYRRYVAFREEAARLPTGRR